MHQENIFNLKHPFDILGDQVCGGWELGEALKETPNSLRDYPENVCCQKYKTAETKLQKKKIEFQLQEEETWAEAK